MSAMCVLSQATVISDMNDFKQRLALHPLPMPFISPTSDGNPVAAAAGNSKL